MNTTFLLACGFPDVFSFNYIGIYTFYYVVNQIKHPYCLLIFLLIFLPVSSLFSQVKGRVTDASNQLPLGGVQVLSSGKLVDVTDKNGLFELKRGQISDTILFRRLGYKSRAMLLPKDSIMYISLQAAPRSLRGVSVKALGYQSQVFRSPSSIDVIPRKTIERISTDDPTPVFNSIPGIYAHAGAQNTHRITIRGIGARSMYSTTKIKAYLNDIPLSSGMGEVTLEDLDLDLIKRVTLIKGPASTLYGSALGGTILYRTRQNTSPESRLELDNTIGSFGLRDNSVKFDWQGERTSLGISVNRYSKNGFRENDDYDRQAITILAQHHFSNKTHLTYLGRFHDLKAYIPSSVNRQTFNDNPEQAASNWLGVKGYEKYYKLFNGFSLHHQFSSVFSNETGLFHKSYEGYERRPFNVLDDGTQTVGVRSVFNILPDWFNAELSLNIGFETFYDDYTWKTLETLPDDQDGKLLTNNRQQRYYQNIFSSFKIVENKFIIDGGVNLNKTGYKYKDNLPDSIDFSTNHQFDWVISPRLSVSYLPADYLNIYGSVSHGFSAPSYEEAVNSEGFANTGLKPETGWNTEAGVKMSMLDDRVTFKTTIFSLEVNNLLVTKRLTEDQYTKINAGETLHNGMETFGSFDFLKSELVQGAVKFSYTFSDYQFEDFSDDGESYNGNNLPGISRHKIFSSLNIDIDNNYFVYTDVIWVDKMPMNDANSLYSDDYHRMNLRIGWQKRLTSVWKVKLYGGIRNITAQHYASMILVNAVGYGGQSPRYFYPAPPRNYYAGFSISYIFNKLRGNN